MPCLAPRPQVPESRRVSIPEEALKKRPTFGLSLLLEPGRLDGFVGAFDWMLSEIKEVENVGDMPS
jgi:hypothetical protein